VRGARGHGARGRGRWGRLLRTHAVVTQVRGDDGKPVFSHALECIADVMKAQIITNENDHVGICLYGTVRQYGTARSERGGAVS
jgi:hypothetical protein